MSDAVANSIDLSTDDARDNSPCYLWGTDGYSESTCLPEEWDVRVTPDHKVYFIDHVNKKTCWTHPVLKRRYNVVPHLPYGWQKYKDTKGILMFVDHLNETCSYTDPRILLSALGAFSSRKPIYECNMLKHRFHQRRTTAADVVQGVDLSGKVVVITGGNTGLGFETALAIAGAGAHVILACRDAVKAEAAVQRILSKHPGGRVEAMHVDLESLHSIELFAYNFKAKHLPLHVLILNAAVFGVPHGTTLDGVEKHFGVNHLGHFRLFQLLEDVIRESVTRVLVVSSDSHWHPSVDSEFLDLSTIANPPRSTYSPVLAYGASKLCNLLFALEVNRRFGSTGVTCNAIHPGNLLPTHLSRNSSLWCRLLYAFAWPFTKSLGQAAAGVVFVACHPTAASVSGLYFSSFEPAIPSLDARSPDTAAALWELSEKLIAEKTTNQ